MDFKIIFDEKKYSKKISCDFLAVWPPLGLVVFLPVGDAGIVNRNVIFGISYRCQISQDGCITFPFTSMIRQVQQLAVPLGTAYR